MREKRHAVSRRIPRLFVAQRPVPLIIGKLMNAAAIINAGK